MTLFDGMNIGFKDINGLEISEGDIVELKAKSSVRVRCVVRYEKNECRFFGEDKKGVGYHLFGCGPVVRIGSIYHGEKLDA